MRIRRRIELSSRRSASTARATPALTALAAAIAGCSGSPETLTIVSGPQHANRDVAALLARASDELAAPVRLSLGASVGDADAALAALEHGTADLAIVENSTTYAFPNVRTVAPLYPSVLHIAVRPERRGRTLAEAMDGATVFAGDEHGPARVLLDRMVATYAWRGVELSYVDAAGESPDVVFVFAPISPQLAPVLDGYELFSLGRPENASVGSLAAGLSLVAPLLRPFVIPEGTYGSLTPTPIVTVATDTLLVARADTPRVVVYDLMQALQTMGPRLVAQRPDLEVEELDRFDISHLTFPVHSGALAFRARNEPGFFERAAGLFEAAVTAVAAIGTVSLGLMRYWRGLKKNRIDELYAEALAIRAKLSPESSEDQRHACIAELRTLRDRAFALLISESLAADESFRILMDLIDAVGREAVGADRPARRAPADPRSG